MKETDKQMEPYKVVLKELVKLEVNNASIDFLIRHLYEVELMD